MGEATPKSGHGTSPGSSTLIRTNQVNQLRLEEVLNISEKGRALAGPARIASNAQTRELRDLSDDRGSAYVKAEMCDVREPDVQGGLLLVHFEQHAYKGRLWL